VHRTEPTLWWKQQVNTIGNYGELQYNADGSLDIYIQHEVPMGKEPNWLPAPAEGFVLILRAYQPTAELLSGAYKAPPMKRM
jgi:hypothetical protein